MPWWRTVASVRNAVMSFSIWFGRSGSDSCARDRSRRSNADSNQPPGENIRGVEDQVSVERDVSAAVDQRQHRIRRQIRKRLRRPLIVAGEHAADPAFLAPES